MLQVAFFQDATEAGAIRLSTCHQRLAAFSWGFLTVNFCFLAILRIAKMRESVVQARGPAVISAPLQSSDHQDPKLCAKANL